MSTVLPLATFASHRRRLPLLLAGVLMLTLGACATAPTGTRSNAPGLAATSKTDSEPALPAVKLDSATLFQLMTADIAAQRGQPALAYATYMRLAEKIADPRLARRALEIALREQNLEPALESARIWAQLAPRDAQANQSLTVLLVARGLMEEARPRIEAKLKADREAWFNARRAGGPMPEDSPWEQAQRVLLRAPNKLDTYRMLVDLFADDSKEPGAQRILAAQAHFAGAHDLAVDHAKRLVRIDPSAGHTLLLAQYQQNLPDGAKQSQKTLESFLKTNPGNSEITTALARLYTLDQQWDKARSLFETLQAREPDNAEILYILTGLAIQQNDRSNAERFFQAYLAKDTDNEDRDLTALQLSLAQLAEEAKDFPAALKWLGDVRSPVADVTVRIRKAQILVKQGQIDQALETLKRQDPLLTDNEKVQLTLTQAQILRESDRFQSASDVLTQALKNTPDHPDLLYEDAMVAEKQQQMERVERNLRKVIALRPDNPHAYNALGYSLADRNIRLEEARALIDRATELAPNDAYIMDSLGWVMYRQGKTQEALATLKKAYAIKADPEIAIHLGEVLWKLGQTDEARRILGTVKDNAPTAQILRETLTRLGISGI